MGGGGLVLCVVSKGVPPDKERREEAHAFRFLVASPYSSFTAKPPSCTTSILPIYSILLTDSDHVPKLICEMD